MRKVLSIVLLKDELTRLLADVCKAPIDEKAYLSLNNGDLTISIDYQEGIEI